MTSLATTATTSSNTGALAVFTSEFRCVAACLQWPLDEAALEGVRAAASSIASWSRVVAIARRHRVVGLVLNALTKANITPPAEHRNALRALAAEQTHLAMRHAAETIRVDRLLREHGATPVFLKGIPLTLLAYGRLELRHAKDVDVLVDEHHALPVVTALYQAGYLPYPIGPATPLQTQRWLRFGKSLDWVHPQTGTLLELHWRMSDLPQAVRTASLPLQQVQVAGGASVSTLAPDPLIAYLCTHGASHGWSRLKWLADVNALLPACDGIEPLYRRLITLGAGHSAGQALLLCHRHFGTQLPTSLLTELTSRKRLRRLVRRTLHLLARGDETTEIYDLRFGTSSVYLSRLLLGSGLRATAAELKPLLFPVEQVATSRLPSQLLFLYPAVRGGSWIANRIRNRGRSRQPR